MSCLALTGCLASAKLRDLAVNPKNLIRFVPAEGLDVHIAPIPVFSNQGGAIDAQLQFSSCYPGSPFSLPPAGKRLFFIYLNKFFFVVRI